MRIPYFALFLVLTVASLPTLKGQQPSNRSNVLSKQGITHLESPSSSSARAAQEDELVSGRFYRLIQFGHLPLESEWQSWADAGIKRLEYIPHHTFLVSMPKNLDPGFWQNGNIQGISALPVDWKIHTNLKNGSKPSYAVRKTGTLDVIVQYFADLEMVDVKGWLKSSGGEILEQSELGHWVKVRVPDHAVNRFANLPVVASIEPVLEDGEPESDNGRGMHRSNVLDTDWPGGLSYDGTGVSAVINDDGFVGPHIDFKGRTEQASVANDLTGNHGDMTAGILGGAGNLDPSIRGMAPGSLIHILQYSSNMNATVNRHVNDQVMVFSTSYSNGCNAGYTAVTAQIDQEVNNYPSIHQVFSAGNNGGSDCGYGAGSAWGNITGGHKIAKNVMACANLNSDESLVNSSSRGPASDGRLKPDISSHGNGQMSTDEGNAYQVGSGTSAAAPGVSGVSVQLYHAYKDLNGGNNPENALIKALIMNTADDLGNPGPDFSYGFGRINARKAYESLSQNQYLTGTVSNGASQNHTIAIPANVKKAKIMLYWRDPAASTLAAKALVNDLDLTVNDPGNTLFRPLVLNATPNPGTLGANAVQAVDTLNNNEQVTIDNPAAGNYTVTIAGSEVPMGPQGYYITWTFELDEIVVTYPSGGESFQPFVSETIRWDASGNTGTFTVEHSTNNGTSWSTLASGLPGNLRAFPFNPPMVSSGQCLIRISRGAVSGVSQNRFSIMDRPINLTFPFACPDSVKLTWNSIAGATAYEVSLLGPKYMDSVATVTTNSYVFQGLNLSAENWVSVKAFGLNGAISRRALARMVPQTVTNCVVPNDVQISNLVPASGQFWSCLGSPTTPVKVTVTNTGVNTVGNFPIKMVLNGGSVVTETFSGNIAPGASAVHTFATTINTSLPGSVNVEVYADLAADNYRANDTVQGNTTMVAGGQTVTPNWSDNMETFTNCPTSTDCEATTCSLPNGWMNNTNGIHDGIDFRTNSGGTPSNLTGPTTDHNPGSSNGKYVYLEASGPCPEMEAIMLSPCIDLTNSSSATASFWYHMYGTDMGTLRVGVISDMELFPDQFGPITGNNGNIWKQGNIDLTPYLGKRIALVFSGVTGDDYASDLALDDINVSGTLVANTNPNSVMQTVLYPNPNSGHFNLQWYGNEPNKDIEVKVFDMRMKEMAFKQLNIDNLQQIAEMDCGNLSNGLYFVQLRVGEQVKVLKFEVINP